QSRGREHSPAGAENRSHRGSMGAKARFGRRFSIPTFLALSGALILKRRRHFLAEVSAKGASASCFGGHILSDMPGALTRRRSPSCSRTARRFCPWRLAG